MKFTAQHSYYTLDHYLKHTFKTKVFKVSLNSGLTCPNRDGTLSTAGCLFCSEYGSGEYGGNPGETLKTQFEKGKKQLHRKWPKAKYIAYFQANTNTYASLNQLKTIFEESISLDPNIVALSIATRCDSIDNDILSYLSELNKQIPIWLEIGLQSIHAKTMKTMNLGYNLEQFTNAVRKIRAANISVIVHIINGLPGETKEMMIETANYLNSLDIQGLKIHSLFLVSNSPLGKSYLKKPFLLLSLDEYSTIVAEQLAVLNDNIVIHRINGDPSQEKFIAPEWALKKLVIMNEIDKKMRSLNYYQGCKSHPN